MGDGHVDDGDEDRIGDEAQRNDSNFVRAAAHLKELPAGEHCHWGPTLMITRCGIRSYSMMMIIMLNANA